jgi:hypothetical protein
MDRVFFGYHRQKLFEGTLNNYHQHPGQRPQKVFLMGLGDKYTANGAALRKNKQP